MKNRPILIDAIRALKEDASVSTRGDEIIWNDGNPTDITREQIEDKLTEMQSEYDLSLPFELLREERDRRLAETDWWAIRSISEKPMTYQQKDYRQRLRDLPSIANPRINEFGELYNFEWPIKPE